MSAAEVGKYWNPKTGLVAGIAIAHDLNPNVVQRWRREWREATVMRLSQSVTMNRHDPHACLKDVLTRLPTHLNRRIEELLPHHR
jgi:transposase-like protein